MDYEQVKRALNRILQEPVARRGEQLERECAGDAALREELESLLAADDTPELMRTGGVGNLLMDPPPPPRAWKTTGRVGPYEILAPLGEGGMGSVFRARDHQLERDVALKTFPPHFLDEPGLRGAFRREARVLASIRHPHIATVYSFEEIDGQPFIAMELVPGRTLASALQEGTPPLRRALGWCLRIARAVEEAGADLILHDCGELTMEMVAALGGLRPSVLSLGSCVDIVEASRVIPKDVVLFGNVPSKFFPREEEMPLEKVRAICADLRRRMEAEGHPFILGSECDVLCVSGHEESIMA
ncbi:protein kinase, partial [bacterium]|nr:protein kinase [bacterium]